MDATLDGSEASAMRSVVRTARKIYVTETTDLVSLDVLMDTQDQCVCKVRICKTLYFY